MNFFTAVNATPAPVAVTAGIVQDGLWLDLRPQYTSGTTVLDQSGGGRNGTLYNGAIVTTTPTGETAFYTDGVNDAVHYRITSAGQKPSTGFPFTTEAWLYRDDSLASGASLASFGKPHNSRYRFFTLALFQTQAQIDLDRSVRGEFYTNNKDGGDNTYSSAHQGTNNIETQTTYPTTNQTWYHLSALYYEVSGVLNYDLYVNGELIREANSDTVGSAPINSAWPWEGSVSASYPMSWGYGYDERYTAADYYRNIYAGDMRMYTRKLTASEILQNFNATKENYGY